MDPVALDRVLRTYYADSPFGEVSAWGPVQHGTAGCLTTPRLPGRAWFHVDLADGLTSGQLKAAQRSAIDLPRSSTTGVRKGHASTLRIDEPKAAIVRRAYELSTAGCTDWEVAAQTGLAKTAEVLTNPICAGRLRTSEPAGIGPIVEPPLWSRVQTARETAAGPARPAASSSGPTRCGSAVPAVDASSTAMSAVTAIRRPNARPSERQSP